MISLKDYLLEKRRNQSAYSIPETPYAFFLSLIDTKENLDDWFVTFTNRQRKTFRNQDLRDRTLPKEKLGIYPATSETFDTPGGIYCYDLKDYEEPIKTAKRFYGKRTPFPYVGDSPTVHFFKMNPNATRMDFTENSVYLNGKRMGTGDYKAFEDKLRTHFNTNIANPSRVSDELRKKLKRLKQELLADEKFDKNMVEYFKTRLYDHLDRKQIVNLMESLKVLIYKTRQSTDYVSSTELRKTLGDVVYVLQSVNLALAEFDSPSKRINELLYDLMDTINHHLAMWSLEWVITHTEELRLSPFNKDILSTVYRILKDLTKFNGKIEKQRSQYQFLYNKEALSTLKDTIKKETGEVFVYFDKYKSTFLIQVVDDLLGENFGRFKRKDYTQDNPHFDTIREQNPMAYFLWSGSRHVASLTKDSGRDPVFAWTEILRKVYGLDIIVDHGLGLIHTNEASQAVVVNTKMIDKKTVKYLDNVTQVHDTFIDTYERLKKIFLPSTLASLFVLDYPNILIGGIQQTLHRFGDRNGYDIDAKAIVHDPEFIHDIFHYTIHSTDNNLPYLIRIGKAHMKNGAVPFYVYLWRNSRFRKAYESKYGKDTEFHQLVAGVGA